MYFQKPWLRNLGFLLLALHSVAQYTAVPRWGQAVAVIGDALFLHGGKTDQFNSYSYTSAPTTDDLIYLPLSAPFSASSPPWQIVSSSSNSSTPQGPTLAWHTLSAFNTSALLIFGGDPGPNAEPYLLALADSATLLNVFNRLEPAWTTEAQSWANEPIRRIHHSASSTDGKIWLVGGVKDDGSNNALSDHWVFDPDGPSFTQLPSTNGPPDIYGHASIVLSDGRMLIFGGYSQSMDILIPFTTIWVIDTTQSGLTWSLLSISDSSVPSPRRAFVAVLLDDGKILIQGGADARLQTVYGDGWVLDTTQNPMVWTAVDTLSQLGPRYDHFASPSGGQIIIGCGYGPSGAIAPTLHIYNPSTDSFLPQFTPDTSIPASQTLPGPSQTQTQTNTGASGTSQHPSGTGTSTSGIGSGTGTATGSVHPSYTQGGSNPTTPASPEDKAKKTTAIAVGTAFGVLALIAGSIATAYYLKHHRPERGPSRFHLLGGEGSDDGGGDSVHMAGVIPTAGRHNEKFRRGPSAWFGNKEFNSPTGQILNNAGRQRRDMFADEDREFGLGSVYEMGRDGSGGSSWSLRSMGAVIGSVGAGVRGILSRENSEDARTIPREVSDPFSDVSFLHDDDYHPYDAAIIRPQSRQQIPYAGRSYHDPFADHPIDEDIGERDSQSDGMDADESTHLTLGSRSTVPPTLALHTLLPLTEQSSRTSDPTSLSSSQLSPSPFESNPSSSYTSHEYRPQRRSMVDSSPTSDTPIRRSDSWWTRFSRTPFLERRSSGGRSPTKALDFRDPNPPPRLLTIQEASSHSNSPESPESQSRRNNRGHRQSQSSLHTVKTADTDAIERMGGMDVIQRVGTNGSHQTTPSAGHDIPEREPSWIPRPLSDVASSGLSGGRSEESQSQSHADDERTVSSPVDTTHSDQSHSPSDSSMPLAVGPSTPSRPSPSSKSNVLSRVHDYERRMSQGAEGINSPGSPISPTSRNTRSREEHPSKSRVTINYGLAPRPSLFVVNPDHRGNPSSES